MQPFPDAARRLRLRDLPATARWLLVLLMIAGALLRAAYQYDRPFVGDEGGTMLYIAKDYRHLLTHFSDPWLSMNVYLCVVKFLAGATGGARWALVLPGFLAGIAAIPLMASLVLRFASRRTALLAAALMAFNPYLVEYGVVIRAYSLFILAVLAMLCALYDWCAGPRWRHGLAFGAWTLLALLMHLNTIYYLLFAAMLFLWRSWSARATPLSELVRASATLAVPVLVALAAAAAAYAPMFEPLREYKLRWSHTPPTPIDYLPQVATRYFGAGFFMLPSLALLAAGLWHASQKNHPLVVLGAAIVLPVAASSLLGSAYLPWAYARYFLPALPLLLIYLACGVGHLAGGRTVPGAALAAVLLASWVPAFRDGFVAKRDYPWIELQARVRQQMKPGDLLLPMDADGVSTGVNLYPYFPPKRFAAVAGYTRAQDAGEGGLIVITPSRPLVTRAPHGRAGKIQWVLYRGSRTDIARTLLGDLLRTVGNDVSPRLVTHYQMILALGGEFGLPDPNGTFTDRYHRCRAATQRQRFLPPQLLNPPPD